MPKRSKGLTNKRKRPKYAGLPINCFPPSPLWGAPCIKALQTLEQRRDEQEWNDADNVPAQEVIESFHLVVRALKEKNGSEPTRKHEY